VKYLKYFFLFFVIILFYPLYITFLNPISPRKSINYELIQNNFKTFLLVDYSSPQKKDRLIFGSKEDGALVPYGKYWRTGANFCTDFYTSSNILFNGSRLEAGKYFLYTIPKENSWDVVLNSDHGRFGFFNPNKENDVLITTVPSYNLNEVLEEFTIDFIEKNENIYLRLRWDNLGISILINQLI
tara:strand:- start:134 stop:688 length:555 start_codon:yes stop_codon:yes gene_type:complete